MMGTKPMGNLALSLTAAYYGGLLIVFLLFSTFLPSSVFGEVMFFGFLFFGVALFFLPLNSMHREMQLEKRRLLREMLARYPRLDDGPAHASAREDATLGDLRDGHAKLSELQELELLERKISSLPTWPFDIQLLGRLVTIVVSVIAAFAARIIIDILRV